MEPTDLFCGNLFFWGLKWVWSGSPYMHVKFRIMLFGGFVWKNRGPQELSQEHQKQRQHSKGVAYNPWDVRGPLEILSRTGQKTSARGLFTTLWIWESFEVHLEFCQQAKAACILAFAPSTDDVQDGKRRYQAQLQFLKFLTPDWWIFLSPKIKVHLFKIALWVNCGLTSSRWKHFGVYHTSGWQNFAAFRREQKWHENFRQARIYNFRVKCVVFARNRKFAKLTQWYMQYIPCNHVIVHFLPKKHCFWPKKGTVFAQRSPKSA